MAATIFAACPGMRGETVFKRRFKPENLTSTSAISDLELAESSLMLSLTVIMFEEVLEEVGDGSSELLFGAMAVGELMR